MQPPGKERSGFLGAPPGASLAEGLEHACGYDRGQSARLHASGSLVVPVWGAEKQSNYIVLCLDSFVCWFLARFSQWGHTGRRLGGRRQEGAGVCFSAWDVLLGNSQNRFVGAQ